MPSRSGAGLHDTRRPAFAFRIGITGARALPPRGSAERSRIESDMAHVLALMHRRLARALARPDVVAAHDPVTSPRLVCLSPLADGADRLFARAALALADRAQAPTVELRVALPFAREAYAQTLGNIDGLDQPSSLAEFDALAAHAAAPPLVLDGNAHEPHAAYAAIGQLVARQSDVLIAVWDKTSQPNGPGGTRDIVHFALNNGIPVWCIDALGIQKPALWRHPADLTRATQTHVARLGAIIASCVIPPAASGPDPLATFLAEPLRANRNLWLWHAGLIGTLRRRLAHHDPADFATPPALLPHLATPHRRRPLVPDEPIASQLSSAYQHRYRTSYLAIYLLGAAALILAVLGVGHALAEWPASLLEGTTLGLIATLVLVNRRAGWHRRYLDYRLLAELLRAQPFLAPLGWSPSLRQTADEEANRWIAWLAAAQVRAEPLPHGELALTVGTQKSNLLNDMIGSQIAFHTRRRRECKGASEGFSRLGTALFVLTLICVAAKIALLLIDEEHFAPIIETLGWAAAFAPALSAAVFGLDAYEEFEPLAESSTRIITQLTAASQTIAAIDPNAPLASQRLAEAASEAAQIMLSEVSGWTQTLRTNPIEAP